ncbi:tetratricopeptide repeat protein [Novosphingobium profundi]|uniref:SPOR domain-containing protein n=1 Tax=Novosphingobium profundi TaxID=1774954 RepID=UPI001BDB6755|nr:tetratricopeptide repeat protein [Novosphingobium profundi]MBT0666794.1 tetratricopeptide repeat protein [Novosphingobium profundi]
MQRTNIQTRHAGFAVCTALAAALLGGFVSHSALARSEAEAVSGEAQADAVSAEIAKAEKRVARSMDSASRRGELANAYLAAGRFESAATSFRDAMTLGDDQPRTALGLALACIGSGRNAEALQVLAKYRDRIPASDLGLAVALAGQPSQGVAILTDVVRGGENSPKSRQNLAYAYALSGQWAQARVIAAQDIPGDQLNARLSEWARTARPQDSAVRVAGLLGTPRQAFDPGQPAALALGGGENAPAMAEADPIPVPPAMAAAEMPAVEGELPALARPEPMAPMPRATERESAVALAEVSQAPVSAEPNDGVRYVARPVVQRIPEVRMGKSAQAPARSAVAKVAARAPSAARVAEAAPVVDGTHLVQLGSFRTMEGAQRAWGIFVARDPRLKDHTMRITEALVAGRRYYRVAAEGFDRGAAQTMCSTVKSRGNGCLAYADGRELPGAVPAMRGSAALRARR